MHPNVHCSTIYHSQKWKQTKWPSTDKWINMCYGTMQYHSAFKKNEIMLCAATWMDLEVSRKRETNTIWCHLHVESEIWHKWTYLWNRNRFIDTKDRFTVTREVEWEKRGWESGRGRCKSLYEEWINSGSYYIAQDIFNILG